MTDDRDIAPENGRRARILKSGEVGGSGSGTGGGNPSEEYDTDEQGTDQPASTGAVQKTPAQGAGDRPGGPAGPARGETR